MTVIKNVRQRYEFSGGGFNTVTVVGFVDTPNGIMAITINEYGNFGSENLNKLSVNKEEVPYVKG